MMQRGFPTAYCPLPAAYCPPRAPQAFRLAGGACFPSAVLPFAGAAFFAAAFGLAAPGAFAAAGFRAGLAGLPSRSAISSIASCRVIASSAIDLGIVALTLPQLT